MPFAPATLYDERENCYKNMRGVEHTSTFMTVTVDCTKTIKSQSPAAVHVDGTARPQLVSELINLGFHRVLSQHHRLTGIPSVINTSFNMYEELIVCTPAEAIRAFQLGNRPYLAIGSYLVRQ
jgi:carbamoyltransferase